MKKLKLFILLFCGTMISHAQSPEKAKQLLKEVSDKVQQYENILIDFNFTVEDPEDKSERVTRGDVSLKGDKYLLNIMGTTRLFDGEKLYTIIPEDEEIVISTYDPAEDQAITPSKMFSFFNKGYEYEWDIIQNVNGRKIQYIRLTPVDPKSEVDNIYLGIDPQTKHIYNLIQTLDDGSKTTITITSFKTDQPISENLFTFKKERYPGYYITRLD